jgi:hypothetical protein
MGKLYETKAGFEKFIKLKLLKPVKMNSKND